MTNEKIKDGESPQEPIKTSVIAKSEATEGAGMVSPTALRLMIQNETEIRGLIKTFISEHLKDGVDFGKIHIVSKDKCPKAYTGCDNAFHYSKDTLFKAGAEKFTSLFHLKPIFKRDDETWEMLGKPAGTFCYVCTLVNSSGHEVAEGRGACSVQEKYGQVNNAIKIAEKRAQMDAVLRHGGLSDFFTQDLEDEVAVPKKVAPKAIAGVSAEVSRPVKPAPVAIYECKECAKIITKAEYDYSMRIKKVALCRICQKKK